MIMRNTKVLAFCGSPRKDGNTSIILEEFLKGCNREGASVERLDLSDFSITPCRECLACFQVTFAAKIK